MRIIFVTFMLLIVTDSRGQDTVRYHNAYPSGISISYGTGNYSVKDEYISKEKYSGTLPYYSLEWVRAHSRYVYRLEMAYRNADNIDNYNVSTDITQFTINQSFLYSLNKKSFLGKELYLWLGPSMELFIYSNDQNIAVSGFDYTESFAGLFSLGLNADAIYPVSDNFQLESALRLSVLSLGFRKVDEEEDGDESAVKPLTLFSGLNSSFNLGARYHLSNRLSVKAAYRFELTRIDAWDPLTSVSDNVIIGLTYKTKGR